MLFEDLGAELILFHLPLDLHPCPFKPKIDAADSCEEGTNGEPFHRRRFDIR